jgi:hypothetical protein
MARGVQCSKSIENIAVLDFNPVGVVGWLWVAGWLFLALVFWFWLVWLWLAVVFEARALVAGDDWPG